MLIIHVYWENKGYYGYRRIYRDMLELHNYKGSRDCVRKRVKLLGIKAIVNCRFKLTTNSEHNKPIATSLLNQDLSTTAINQVWVGDITYICIVKAQWMYLAVVLDC